MFFKYKIARKEEGSLSGGVRVELALFRGWITVLLCPWGNGQNKALNHRNSYIWSEKMRFHNFSSSVSCRSSTRHRPCPVVPAVSVEVIGLNSLCSLVTFVKKDFLKGGQRWCERTSRYVYQTIFDAWQVEESADFECHVLWMVEVGCSFLP